MSQSVQPREGVVVRRFTLAEVKAATTPGTNWSKFVAHPLADLLLWVMANYAPRIHPNVVTLFAAALGAGAAACFALGTPAGMMVGALLFHAAFCLDAIDGPFARLLGKTSPLGAWLDALLDFSRSMLVAPALAFGTYRMTGDVRALYAGFAVQGVGLLYIYLSEVSQRVMGRRPAQIALASEHPVVAGLKRLGIVPSPIGHADFEGIYLVVFPLLGEPLLGMLIAAPLGFVSRVATALVVLRQLRRLRAPQP